MELFELDDIIIYTDGASRGNPGEAGIGVVIFDKKDKLVKEISRYIGTATNNVAEYKALIEGLKAGLEMSARHVHIKSDSQLLIRQLTGIYRVKNEGLKPLHEEALSLLQKFRKYELEHISREDNKLADKLANEGIEDGSRKKSKKFY